MKRFAVIIAAILTSAAAFAAGTDSLRNHRLRPIEVLGLKQTPGSGLVSEAVTEISGAQARRLGIDAAKGVSIVAPNFYMPEYGSRMTSSIYVRGLGARIDQPVVGLTVDNIPYLNKDNYDFDLADIESIEVLRGAQAVLNGRNTMGGQINIRTLSPLRTEGLRAMLEYGRANTVKASAAYYATLNPRLGMSLSGLFRHTDGYFRNAYNGELLDHENSGSLRWKTVWRPTAALSLSNTATANIARQGGYPYALAATGEISYNDTCSYRRNSFADALTVAWAGKRVLVTSITSAQYLDDRMDLDQDFTPADYFTLTQDRREWAFTEDLFTRGTRGKYNWLGGVYFFYKDGTMDAPVSFMDTGLEKLIEDRVNSMNPNYPIRWDERHFLLGSTFKQRNIGFAVYHESTVALGRWYFEGGLRLDIERPSLDYHSYASSGYTTWHKLPDGSEEVFSHTPVDIDDHGTLHTTYVEFLPKVTISYKGELEPYITFSRAYKAGGYNTQMFSEVLQQRVMSLMGLASNISLEKTVSYKPESSYNYEAGVHWRPSSVPLRADAALFYIDCRDQQLTVFPPGTVTGRMMTNAGRTRSFGAELSAVWRPTDDVTLTASYGYTNATFIRYNDGRNDYRGKHLPYAPSNTLFGELTWRATPLSFSGVTPSLTATARCVGDIWWNDANTQRQKFYCLPGLSLDLRAEHWNLRVWANNLTGTRHDVFYFVSMGNAFVQRGLPLTCGATLRLTI